MHNNEVKTKGEKKRGKIDREKHSNKTLRGK
jgi:hypothetical protein